MPKVETAAHFLENLATEHGYLVSDAGALRLIEERDAAIRAAELARVVKRLRELCIGWDALAPKFQADFDERTKGVGIGTVLCSKALSGLADLLEREGAGA